MSINRKLISVCVAALCVQTCFAAKLVPGNDTGTEDESVKASKSKRNYDAYRHVQEYQQQRFGQENHRFGPAPAHGTGQGQGQTPAYSQEHPGFARGLGYDDGPVDEPHHRSQGYGNEQDQNQQYSQRDRDRDAGHAGNTGYADNNKEQISDHESDIEAAQNTMSLYYDDLVRLQGLMANMISDPHADGGEADYSDY